MCFICSPKNIKFECIAIEDEHLEQYERDLRCALEYYEERDFEIFIKPEFNCWFGGDSPLTRQPNVNIELYM